MSSFRWFIIGACSLFLWIASTGIYAQPAADAAGRAANAILSLKEGVLIVRLPGNHNKITHLQKLAETTNGQQQERFRRMLDQTITETKAEAMSFVRAFESQYTFSEVFYMMDTASSALKKGARSGIFLDTLLRADPLISLGDRPFLVFKKDAFQDMWTVGDATLQDIPRPFPYKTPGRRILIFRIPAFVLASLIDRKFENFYVETIENIRKSG